MRYQVMNAQVWHIENRAWTALYNFLTGNSVLVLAWAAIYTRSQPVAGDVVDLLLVGLAVVGFWIGIAWASFGSRNLAYARIYGDRVREIERKHRWHPVIWDAYTVVHSQGRFFLGYQSAMMCWLPLAFAAAYCFMGFVGLQRIDASSWIYWAYFVIFGVLWGWAARYVSLVVPLSEPSEPL